MATGCDVPIPVTTVDDFRFVLMACFEDARRSRARTISYRWAVIGTSETHHGDIKAVSFKEKIHGNSSKSGNKTPSISKAESVLCQLCGKNNHSNADYRMRTSEFTNNQNHPYVGSEAHGRLVKATGDRDWIPNFNELKGLMSKAEQSPGPSSSAAKTSKPSKDWKSKGTYVGTILPIKLHIATSPNLLPVVLTFVSQEEANGSINVDALLDTGCLAGDFVARGIVDRFNIKPVINSTTKFSVCSGLDNTCYDISKSVIISVNYLDERLNNINTFEIKAIILETSPLDLIIDRATVKNLSLVHQVPSQFLNIRKVLITGGKTSEHAKKCSGCQPKEELQTSGSVPKGSPLVSQLKNPTVSQTSRILASLVLASEQLSRAPLYDDDDIDHDNTDTFKPWSTPSSTTDILPLIHLVMRIYNLDYVHSVQNFRIFLVMIFLRNLLIFLHSI